MKILLLILALSLSGYIQAQVTKVSLQASGLTCSMCSNAINKSLKSIDFVDKVDANIKTSTFEITFKPGRQIDFDRLKKKVESAGFAVASFIATYNFNHLGIKNGGHVKIGDMMFMFLNVKDQELEGIRNIRIIDKGFVSAKEYKNNAGLTPLNCYKTGVAEPCCAKDGLIAGTRIFHATI